MTSHAFTGIKFDTADEALQHANASGRGVVVAIEASIFVVEHAQADRLESAGVSFAYLGEHEMPDGTFRIITVPVNWPFSRPAPHRGPGGFSRARGPTNAGGPAQETNVTTVTQNGVHAFEKAGLGKAPFRIVGCCEKRGPIVLSQAGGVTMTCGAPGQPMGVCDFCGTGIAECWAVRSADGKQFEVGCDCVRKTGDAGMTKVIDAAIAKKRREKAAAKGDADAAYVDAALADYATREKLAAAKHPLAADKPWLADRTALDYVEFVRRGVGNAGLARLAKLIRSIAK